ncbi:hypothetical protein Athai_21770 [Actinocatenispora thailandica]|uniref:DUF2690 domain-containing protein n=1 Tax=Actinocatenispora thailandica TaxID=227318 RepID=A0A7R7DMX2_9ACTN|nr:DUF2690 domain-containing protein [Actinocatenispora thailandica]BCJ34674.1 hypothetical protein Athai_21770 [Actinocatenispora thailandica]
MHMSVRKVISLVAVTLLSAAAALAPATAASAGGCSGSNCEGKYASTVSGCADDGHVINGFTLDGVESGGVYAHADIYYSQACHSAWGEYVTPKSGDISYVGFFYQLPNGGDGEHWIGGGYLDGTQQDFVTTMVDWDKSMKLCVSGENTYDPEPYPGQTWGGVNTIGCTGWY